MSPTSSALSLHPLPSRLIPRPGATTPVHAAAARSSKGAAPPGRSHLGPKKGRNTSQIAIKFGSNGLFTQHRDGIADLIRLGITASGDPQGVRIGHYWATSADGNCPTNPGASVYTDLVYVDNTLARVVLGDQPVFDASRVMAIQIPFAWSSSQITAKVNTARFASGSTAYVFVVDANNVASPGFRVTISQGSVTPNPPTDVTAN